MLARMLAAIRLHGKAIFGALEPTTAAALIHENAQWRALRSEAQVCLAVFGVPADQFVAAEIREKRARSTPG